MKPQEKFLTIKSQAPTLTVKLRLDNQITTTGMSISGITSVEEEIWLVCFSRVSFLIRKTNSPNDNYEKKRRLQQRQMGFIHEKPSIDDVRQLKSVPQKVHDYYTQIVCLPGALV